MDMCCYLYCSIAVHHGKNNRCLPLCSNAHFIDMYIDNMNLGLGVPMYVGLTTVLLSPAAQIPEARGLLSHAMHLISALRVSQAQLVEMDAMGERGGEMWGDVMTQVARWRVSLLTTGSKRGRGQFVLRGSGGNVIPEVRMSSI